MSFADWKNRSELFASIQASPSICGWEKGAIEKCAQGAYKAGQRQKPSAWRPIATAPQDGSRCLYANRAEVAVGSWQRFAVFPSYDDGEAIAGMTHWMPLPAPPNYCYTDDPPSKSSR